MAEFAHNEAPAANAQRPDPVTTSVAESCLGCARTVTDGDRLVATRGSKNVDLQGDPYPVWALRTVLSCKSQDCWDSNFLRKPGKTASYWRTRPSRRCSSFAA